MESPPTVFDIFDCKKAIIENPTDEDILCGKDKTFNLHPGNLRFRQLIEENGVHYAESATKQGKMKITKAIVDAVQKSGARFLEKADGSSLWTQLANAKARDKTSHALRFFCKHHIKHIQDPICVPLGGTKPEPSSGKHVRTVSNEGVVLKPASDTATSSDSILREFAEVYLSPEPSLSMEVELYSDTIRSVGSQKDSFMDTWRSRDTLDFNLDTLRSQDLRDLMECVPSMEGDTDGVMAMVSSISL